MSYMFWPVVLLINLVYLIAGFSLLILAGDKLVETSVRMAQRWNIPASVIAVTLIASGTSAPELVTSFLAALKESSEISIGNVIGSNIFNILAVGGLSLAFQPNGKLKGSFFSWPLLIVASFLFLILLYDLSLSRTDGILLVVGLLGFIVISLLQQKSEEAETEQDDKKVSTGRTFIFFLVSLCGLIFGANLALTGGVEIGRLIGLSERVIAITIISVGTGLPELATSIAASLRGHNDVAIANILGSNVFNTLAIPGITASFFTLGVSQKLLSFDMFVMLGATFLIGLVFLLKSPAMKRGLGIIFFLLYSAYALKLLLM